MAIGLVLLLIATASYIFFIYIPNRPENIYRRALGSVGSGLDLLDESELLSFTTTTSYSGQFIIKYPGLFSGARDAATTDGQSRAFEACLGSEGNDGDQLQIDVSGQFNLVAGEQVVQDTVLHFDTWANTQNLFGAEIRLLGADDGELLPTIYYYLDKTECVEGLRDLIAPSETLDAYVEDLFDNWWKIDFQEFIDLSIVDLGDLEELVDQLENLTWPEHTQQDYEEINQILVDSLQTYIFTADTDKMVFQMDELVDAQADYEGTPTKRYSTTINRQNMVAMSKQLRDQIHASQAYNKIIDLLEPSEVELEEYKSSWDDDRLEEDAQNFAETTTVEIWVDAKTGILRNLRFTDNDLFGSYPGNYLDLGLTVEEEAKLISVSAKYVGFDIGHDCARVDSSVTDEDDCPYQYQLETIDCRDSANADKCSRAHKFGGNSRSLEYDHEACSDISLQDYDTSQDYSDARDECLGQNIKTVTLKTLKAGASPRTVISITSKLNVDSDELDLEIKFETHIPDKITFQINLEVVKLVGAPAIEVPAEATSFAAYLERELAKLRQVKEADTTSLQTALDAYRARTGSLPQSDDDFKQDVLAEVALKSYNSSQINYEPFTGLDYEEEASGSPSPSLKTDQVYIFAGYACTQTDFVSSWVANFVEQANRHTDYVLVYGVADLDGQSYICLDNS